MANVILGDGQIVTRTAPVGGVTSGTPVVIGSEFLIPLTTALVNETFAAQYGGEVWLTADAADTFTEGLKIYWDPTAGECEDSDSTVNYEIGTACGAATGGRVRVRLNGVGLGALTGDLAAKIDKVPAITGIVPKFTAAGGLETSGILAADVQVDTVPAIAGNLAGLDAAGKLTDSGLAAAGWIAALPAAVVGNVPAFAAGGASVTDSGILAANLQVLVVPAAAGNVASLDVLGALTDSTVPAANLQVLVVPGAPNNIAVLDAAGALADGGALVAALAAIAHDHTGVGETPVPVAGLDSGVAGAGLPLIADGAGAQAYQAVDSAGIANGSVDPLHIGIGVAATTMLSENVFILELDAEAAATPIDFDLTTNAQLAFNFRIITATTDCTGVSAGGTLQLFDAAAGGGNAITNAAVCAVENQQLLAAVDRTFAVVNGAAETLSIAKNAAGDDGRLILLCCKV